MLVKLQVIHLHQLESRQRKPLYLSPGLLQAMMEAVPLQVMQSS